MGNNVTVNTDVVSSTANTISSCNKSINAEYSSVQSAVGGLNNSWSSPASNYAINKFNEMKKKYSDARSTVLDNYVNFLHTQVDSGYTQTETTNTSLADAFK